MPLKAIEWCKIIFTAVYIVSNLWILTNTINFHSIWIEWSNIVFRFQESHRTAGFCVTSRSQLSLHDFQLSDQYLRSTFFSLDSSLIRYVKIKPIRIFWLSVGLFFYRKHVQSFHINRFARHIHIVLCMVDMIAFQRTMFIVNVYSIFLFPLKIEIYSDEMWWFRFN